MYGATASPPDGPYGTTVNIPGKRSPGVVSLLGKHLEKPVSGIWLEISALLAHRSTRRPTTVPSIVGHRSACSQRSRDLHRSAAATPTRTVPIRTRPRAKVDLIRKPKPGKRPQTGTRFLFICFLLQHKTVSGQCREVSARSCPPSAPPDGLCSLEFFRTRRSSGCVGPLVVLSSAAVMSA